MEGTRAEEDLRVVAVGIAQEMEDNGRVLTRLSEQRGQVLRVMRETMTVVEISEMMGLSRKNVHRILRIGTNSQYATYVK